MLEEMRALRQENNEKFHAIDQRLSSLDKKFSAEFEVVNKKLDMLGGAVVDLRTRVEKLEKVSQRRGCAPAPRSHDAEKRQNVFLPRARYAVGLRAWCGGDPA
ncbi:MAG: hypothetical protein KIT84_30520 [Labilithrix sp.]|nr:hypothetical protein [Labilithrix sp.]